jgi:hypothetical protein
MKIQALIKILCMDFESDWAIFLTQRRLGCSTIDNMRVIKNYNENNNQAVMYSYLKY